MENTKNSTNNSYSNHIEPSETGVGTGSHKNKNKPGTDTPSKTSGSKTKKAPGFNNCDNKADF